MVIATIGAFVVFSAGCVQLMPASANKKGENQYEVTSFGNSFAGREMLEEKVDKKAKKVCKNGVQSISEGEYSQRKEQVYINGFPQTNTFFSFTKTVNCKS